MTAMINGVSVRTILAKAIEIGKENSEYIYNTTGGGTCLYTGPHEGEPGTMPEGGCIVGRALIATGAMTLEDLVRIDGGASPTALNLINNAAGLDGTRSDPESMALDEIQARQDRGLPWGEAVSLVDYEVLA